MRRRAWIWILIFAVAGTITCMAAPKKKPAKAKKPKKKKIKYAKPGILDAKSGGFDFKMQGEYAGTGYGAQVIALGGGKFQSVFYKGGLPGAGWDGSARTTLDGAKDGSTVVFAPAKGTKKYMGAKPEEFSALDKPVPQPKGSFTIAGKTMEGNLAGSSILLKKTMRKSPTLGAKPPQGAKVLLAYEPGKAPSIEGWSNKNWSARPDGSMMVDHPDKIQTGMTASAVKFGEKSYHIHLEFRTSFMPEARSQGRSNSGVFPPTGREVQVLDSFGLEGKPNECGGIYKDHPVMVNMCLPPLSWQTYDIHYTSPADAGGKGFYHVIHNGVVIQTKVELPAAKKAGSLQMQDHLNNVFYRNIWVLEK